MRSYHRILKYSGLAMQIFIMLGVAIWIGDYLDKKWELKQPLMTILLSIGMFVAIFFWLYHDLEKNKE